MALIEIGSQIDAEQERILRSLLRDVPNGFPKVMARILNGVGRKVRTLTLRTVAKGMGIKRADIDVRKGRHRYGGVRLVEAKPGEDRAVVRITGLRIPLYRFGAKQLSRGVRYRQKSLMKGFVKSAFITGGVAGDTGGAGTEMSGHRGVFIRVGPKRYPTKGRYAAGKHRRMVQRLIELYGPSIPRYAAENAEFRRSLEVDVLAMLVREAMSQIDRVLAGVGKRRSVSQSMTPLPADAGGEG